MTSYYKGNNIGLNYDAANATWSFVNEPNDFIDPDSFSTEDPAFDYTPPPGDDDDQEDTTCPPGYIYDETLKQCVPDPNYQVSAFAGAPEMKPGGQREPVLIPGTNRTTVDNNFIATDEEYAAMTADQLLQNFRARGIITKDKISGNTIVDLGRFDNIGASSWDALHKRFGQTSNIARNKKDRVISLLIDKGLVNQMDIYQQGGITATGDFGSIPNQIIIPGTATTPQDVKALPSSVFSDTLNKWKNNANLVISNSASVKGVKKAADISTYTGGVDYEEQAAIEDARKKTADADKAEIEKNIKEKEYQDTFTGGDSQGGEFVTVDKKVDDDKKVEREKPQAPPGQPTTGTHIGYGGGGPSLGSSVHGGGSYTQSKPSKGQSGSQPGKAGWKR